MAILHSACGPRPDRFQGWFLLAAEDLLDPNFYRTAILILQHDETGALGLVLNRPTQAPLGLILPQLEGKAAASLPLFWGGPVQPDYLFFLTETPAGHGPDPLTGLGGLRFTPFTGNEMEYLQTEYERLDLAHRPAVRLLAGYAGWGPGQLEEEMDRHAWYWHRAEHALIFGSAPAELWEAVLSQKGPLFQTLADTGTLPSVN